MVQEQFWRLSCQIKFRYYHFNITKQMLLRLCLERICVIRNLLIIENDIMAEAVILWFKNSSGGYIARLNSDIIMLILQNKCY